MPPAESPAGDNCSPRTNQANLGGRICRDITCCRLALAANTMSPVPPATSPLPPAAPTAVTTTHVAMRKNCRDLGCLSCRRYSRRAARADRCKTDESNDGPRQSLRTLRRLTARTEFDPSLPTQTQTVVRDLPFTITRPRSSSQGQSRFQRQGH